MNILAIDPGSTHSGWVVMDAETLKPLKFAKEPNERLLERLWLGGVGFEIDIAPYAAIEMIASYGMSVGKEVFDTCVWIGRFQEAILQLYDMSVHFVYRKDEKMTICGSMKAKDSNIRRALIDRFAKHDMKNGKGTKDTPDWFYGFKADIWQAYAVGVTWVDMQKERAYDGHNT